MESGLEELEPSSEAWNRDWRSSSHVPTHGIGIGGVRAKFRRLGSEFEPSSRLGIRNGVVRAMFQLLESGMEEFEPSSRLGIGNGGV